MTVFINLSTTLILGIDAINNLGITYLSRTKSFWFQEAHQRVVSALKIPTHTRVPVTLGTTLVTVTGIASMDFPCLFAQHGLVIPDDQVQVMIILKNCGEEDITIPRCSNIEYIESEESKL